MEERERHVFLARVAEEAERYDEMVEYMNNIARMDVELTPDERNLLSIGYKNAIGAKRASWRAICLLEEKEKDSEQYVNRIGQYRKKIEDEIAQICNDVLSVIAIHILPSSTSVESTAFFFKMKGDYYRYLAEFKIGDERKEAADQSLVAYQAATSAATTDLPPSHPIRLGLALNLSVFYYEILDDNERASELAKQAFDEALPQLNSLDEKYYKESRLVLQLLRDNLTMWTTRQRGDNSRETNTDTIEGL